MDAQSALRSLALIAVPGIGTSEQRALDGHVSCAGRHAKFEKR